MSKTYLAVALAGCASAYKIIYPGNDQSIVDMIRVDPSEYPMLFKWPEEGWRCGATMISDQMAITAAHCVTLAEEERDPNLTVRLSDG